MYKKKWTYLNCLLVTFLTAITCLNIGCESTFPLANNAGTLQTKAYDIIANALTATEPEIRGNAVEVIGDARIAPLMPRVVQLLNDPVVPVRFQALIALGDMQENSAWQYIQQIYNDSRQDINVRMAAAYALVKMGSPQCATYYIQQINNPDPTIRANAALFIGKGGHRNNLPLLEWAINDAQSNERVRLQALEAMAMLQSPSAYEKIWTRLISAYADDRITGIQAMGHLKNEQAVSSIMTMLKDEIPEVRLAAAKELGQINDPEIEATVLKVLKNTDYPDENSQIRIKVMAAMAIGQIKSSSLASYLPRLLKDPSKIVQLAAAKAVFKQAML